MATYKRECVGLAEAFSICARKVLCRFRLDGVLGGIADDVSDSGDCSVLGFGLPTTLSGIALDEASGGAGSRSFLGSPSAGR